MWRDAQADKRAKKRRWDGGATDWRQSKELAKPKDSVKSFVRRGWVTYG